MSAAKFYCQQPYLARRNIKGGQWFTIRGPGNKFFIPFLDYYILQKIKSKCSSKPSLGFIFNHGLGLWLHSHWAFITFNGAQTHASKHLNFSITYQPKPYQKNATFWMVTILSERDFVHFVSKRSNYDMGRGGDQTKYELNLSDITFYLHQMSIYRGFSEKIDLKK